MQRHHDSEDHIQNCLVKVSWIFVLMFLLVSLMPSYHLFQTSPTSSVALDRSVIEALLVCLSSAAIHFAFFFFPHFTTPSTYRSTQTNEWLRFLHRCFPGNLMMMDVSGSGVTSRVANDQGVGRCPYPTKVCTLTLADSSFARCSLPIDYSFLYCSLFIPLIDSFLRHIGQCNNYLTYLNVVINDITLIMVAAGLSLKQHIIIMSHRSWCNLIGYKVT